MFSIGVKGAYERLKIRKRKPFQDECLAFDFLLCEGQ